MADIRALQAFSKALGQALFRIPIHLPTTEGENLVWFRIEITAVEVMATPIDAIIAAKEQTLRFELRRLQDAGQIRPILPREQVEVEWSGLSLMPEQDRWEGRLTFKRVNKD